MKNLGHLEKVDLHTVWPSESGDFTPWLGHEANIQIEKTNHNEDFDPEATETWEEQFAWLQETLEAFRENAAPRVKAFLK